MSDEYKREWDNMHEHWSDFSVSESPSSRLYRRAEDCMSTQGGSGKAVTSHPFPFSPDLLETLIGMNTILEDIQKSLDMYLETKRHIFPRFYFLSNDDLLEILGQSRNPEAVQPHLKKCFDNIKLLRIQKVKRGGHDGMRAGKEW